MLFTRKVVSRITATTTAVLMATTYTANLTISCQKQHTCLGCRAEYFYLMERKIAGTGGTEAAAATNAEAAAIKSIENDVDQHACPHCGMMQPDMIAEVRRNRFLAGMWIPPPHHHSGGVLYCAASLDDHFHLGNDCHLRRHSVTHVVCFGCLVQPQQRYGGCSNGQR